MESVIRNVMISPRGREPSGVRTMPKSYYGMIIVMASHNSAARGGKHAGVMEEITEETLSTSQVMKALSLSYSTLKLMRQVGDGPDWEKRGSTIRYSKDSVWEWILCASEGMLTVE